jgi:transcriptional regulator with XRE-family HTH domain
MKLQIEKLAKFVRDEMERQGLDFRKVAERAQRPISHGAVHRLANNISKDIGLNTLSAIAEGLGYSPYQLLAVALDDPVIDKPILTEDETTLLRFLGGINKDQRDFLLKMMLEYQPQPAAFKVTSGDEPPEANLKLVGGGSE